MAKKRISVKCECVLTFEYDPDSKEFKDTLESFKDVIYRKGGEYDVIKQAALHFAQGRGTSNMCEGVGYISQHGRNPASELDSGISIVNSNPDFEIEII